MKTLSRPYQNRAGLEIRQHAAARGPGCILQMPTGAGKTHVFCDLLMGAYNKGKYALMVVRGKALVHQASERLTREGVPHGIYQGGNTTATHERILVCSIDTLFQRKIAPHADLIVIDECHLSHSEGYTWFLSQYTCFKLGVSATPHHKKGMRHIGDKLIYPAPIMELIRDGYLVGAKYFVPYIPDLKGVSKTNGDFNAKELGKRSVEDEELTANAAMVWERHLRGLSTLCFASSIEHGRVLSEALRGKGAHVGTIVAATKDDIRKQLITKLEHGQLDVLVSVGVLTTGVDIPSLAAILCCRPTESYNLWIQILGRGTRPFSGKPNFLVYDLSGNLLKHGPIEAETIADMDGMITVPKTALVLCQECYAIHVRADLDELVCPSCGATLPSRVRTTGGMRSHGLTDNHEVVEKLIEPWELDLPGLVAIAKEKRLKKGWIYHMIRGKYGEDVGNRAWPRIRSIKKWDTNKSSAPQQKIKGILYKESRNHFLVNIGSKNNRHCKVFDTLEEALAERNKTSPLKPNSYIDHDKKSGTYRVRIRSLGVSKPNIATIEEARSIRDELLAGAKSGFGPTGGGL